MKNWIVSVPVVGRMEIYVEGAASKEDAIKMAFAGQWDEAEIVEREIVTECRGHVCHLMGGIEVIAND